MDRRKFLAALGGIIAAPRLLERLRSAVDVRPFFLYRDNSLAHAVDGRWYVYPVSVPSGGATAMLSSDSLMPPCSSRQYLEVRSDRALTADEVRARAREMLRHTLHT